MIEKFIYIGSQNEKLIFLIWEWMHVLSYIKNWVRVRRAFAG